MPREERIGGYMYTYPLPPASLVGFVDLGTQHLDVILDLLDLLVDRGNLSLVLIVVRLRLGLKTKTHKNKKTQERGEVKPIIYR